MSSHKEGLQGTEPQSLRYLIERAQPPGLSLVYFLGCDNQVHYSLTQHRLCIKQDFR